MTREEIKKLVEEKTGHNLLHKNRSKDLVIAKRVYFFIGRRLCDLTNQHLCSYLNIDHSTASIHYDRASSWVEQKDVHFCNVLNKVLGYKYVTGLKLKELRHDVHTKLSEDSITDLIEAIPEDKRSEALERFKLMVKGYNMVHGKDKITIIRGYE